MAYSALSASRLSGLAIWGGRAKPGTWSSPALALSRRAAAASRAERKAPCSRSSDWTRMPSLPRLALGKPLLKRSDLVCRSSEESGREGSDKTSDSGCSAEGFQSFSLEQSDWERSMEKGREGANTEKNEGGRKQRGDPTGENLVKAESDFLTFTGYIAKYLLLMLVPGAALETFAHLTGAGPTPGGFLWFSWMAGVVVGHMVGAARVLDGYAWCGPRNVVVTGSTRGLGKALAREFLLAGDNVFVTARSEEAVVRTVRELQAVLEEAGRIVPQAALWLRQPLSNDLYGSAPQVRCLQSLPGAAEPPSMPVKNCPGRFEGLSRYFICSSVSAGAESAKGEGQSCGVQKIVGIACNVQDADEVRQLADVAQREFQDIHLWINNAGANMGAKPFLQSTSKELEQVVSTNLLGSLLCTKEAVRVMEKQSVRGHVFSMDGAGSEGGATPQYAVYGATKCGLRQFHTSLLEELKGSFSVGIHTASPGMVLTDLLLTGSTLQNKQAFNIVCEQPETVARALVPRMRAIRGTGQAVNYLTPPRIILAIITAWLRRGRWFDEEGRAVYATEADRLRNWAKGRDKSSLTDVMEVIPSSAWVSLLTSSAIGVYLFVTSHSLLNG